MNPGDQQPTERGSSGTLPAALLQPGKKEAVVADCVRLIDEEVAAKSGISSIPVKAGYKLVKGLKPGFVALATERLLPDFAEALEPVWKRGVATGEPERHLRERDDEVAESLLGVTDGLIELAGKPVRAAYTRLRGSAKQHVKVAVPRLAALLGKHAG